MGVLSSRSGRFILRLLPTTTQRLCASRRALGPAERKRSVNRDCARLFTDFFFFQAPLRMVCVSDLRQTIVPTLPSVLSPIRLLVCPTKGGVHPHWRPAFAGGATGAPFRRAPAERHAK